MNVVEPVQGDEDHGADQVGPVVHRDVGLVLRGGGDMPVVAVLVLALDGVDRDAEVLHQAGGDVVLGRKRVGGAEQEIGASGLEGPRQVGRLGGDVQAGRHPHAGQRLLVREPLANAPAGRACRARPTQYVSCRRLPARSLSHRPCVSLQSRLPKSILLSGVGVSPPLKFTLNRAERVGCHPPYDESRRRKVLRRSQSIQSSGPGS